jgi:hypothetical protein
MKYVLVDPSSRLNWPFQWDDPAAPWLAEGDTIVSRQWLITPHGVGPGAPTLVGAGTDTVVVSGMLAGCC